MNPRIIYVRGHGQGARGPDAERGGYDAASFWCRGSICNALTPAGAATPVMQRAAFGDSTGGLALAGGIAAALFRRERTGERLDRRPLAARHRDVDDGARHHRQQAARPAPMPQFTRADAPNPIVNSYRTKDGRWLFLNMLQPDRFWPDLCRRIGHPELIDDERFKDGMSRFMNRADCVQPTRRRSSPNAPSTSGAPRSPMPKASGRRCRTPRELHDDPQATANGYLLAGRARRRHVVHAGRQPAPVRRDAAHRDAAPPTSASTPRRSCSSSASGWEDIATYKEAGAIS